MDGNLLHITAGCRQLFCVDGIGEIAELIRKLSLGTLNGDLSKHFRGKLGSKVLVGACKAHQRLFVTLLLNYDQDGFRDLANSRSVFGGHFVDSLMR